VVLAPRPPQAIQSYGADAAHPHPSYDRMPFARFAGYQQIIAVDPGFAVDPGYWDAPDQPRNPE
jgi:hypothetical protein